jgi:hypothetical protein
MEQVQELRHPRTREAESAGQVGLGVHLARIQHSPKFSGLFEQPDDSWPLSAAPFLLLPVLIQVDDDCSLALPAAQGQGEPSDRPHQLRWGFCLTEAPRCLAEASHVSACICRGLRESASMCPRVAAFAESIVSGVSAADPASGCSLGRQREESSRERLTARERV